MTTNVTVRDLNLVGPHVDDAWRPEVVADGLPLFLDAQLAVDTTLVSAPQANGSARRRAAQQDGVAAEAARQRKVRWLDLTAGLTSLSWRSWETMVGRVAGIHHPVGEGESTQ